MYWSILVNISPTEVIDYGVFDRRFGDEARFKFPMGYRQIGLTKIIVYDVQALWYKTMGSNGHYNERYNDDVVQEVRDHLYHCGHDVISCQLERGIP